MKLLTKEWSVTANTVYGLGIFISFTSFKLCSMNNNGKPLLCLRLYGVGDSLIASIRLTKEEFTRFAKDIRPAQIDDTLTILPCKKKTHIRGPIDCGRVAHDI